ncbi:ATP-dependent helicase [Metamycoplasma neophronis]|uniref:DNA 3'-5' helicase n=1 Tax=Metamycoplasma neophronis TaxID=872983 RepID=A0ABY2Z004_9BACT|nr:UvrD-helicase domain-containing protein [Metamycoplasma neophronis]TPR53854.1 ATP-dependent DNA helicase [Metamycoplasma neophronis]
MININLLNEQQKSAVIYNEGPLRIIAGAGSGKTRVLTYKIAYLIENLGIKPSRILALTFSNKAANEMRQRVFGILANSNLESEPVVSTFHAMCAKILRKEIHNFGYTNDFQILDELDQKEILKIVYSELDISQTEFTYSSILSYIQNRKNEIIDFNKLDSNQSKEDEHLIPIEKEVAKTKEKIYEQYQAHLQRSRSLDFDDLLVFVFRLFYDPKFSAIAAKWEKRFDYVLIDEFQDTSLLQYKIMQKLASTEHLTIVGDPDQTIYSWRNADINIIMNFDKDYPETVTVKLEENYRSTKKILKAANNLISYNKLRLDKKLFTENEEGEEIEFFCGFNDEAEARWIANKISELKRNRVQLKNIAILYRVNSYSRAIEEALVRENTIYKLFGSIKFYQREEIKDALAYLRVIHDGSEISLLRIINKPSRKIGQVTIDKLLNFARKENLDLFQCLETNFSEIQKELRISMDTLKNIANLINEIRWARRAIQTNPIHLTLKEFMLNKIKYFEEFKNSEEEYESRLDNFNSLIEAIETWENKNPSGSIDEYLQEITLITDRDVEDDAASYVSLMTVHNAKGLEFDYVFIAGLSENIFPLKRAIILSPQKDFTFLKDQTEENPEGLEEERRLAYVAMTRAKKRLFLSFSVGRNGINKKSRFLSESGINEGRAIRIANNFSIAAEVTNNNDFIVGDFITHKTYGKGVILEIFDGIIEVKFDIDKKIRKLDKNHAAIKKWDENE